MSWTQDKIDTVLEKVSKRAITDATYRKLALASPKEAIAQFADEPVPANFKIRFVDNAGADMTFVLPDPVKPGNELSDSDLEAVAGGKCGVSCGNTHD